MPILAKDYIKNLQSLQNYECTICFDIEPSVMRCRGPCKTNVCLICATNISITNGEIVCPQRCSPILQLEPIPNLQIEFHCPYDQEKCKKTIKGKQEFAEHCLKCQFITTEAVTENIKSQEHVCNKEHPLLFLDREAAMHFFNEMSISTFLFKCAGCGVKKFCRSYCDQCSTIELQPTAFCYECRALPITKELCPNGIHMLQKRIAEKGYYCDICAKSAYLISEECYADIECDICVCIPCYQRLPESHHLVPLESNISHKQKLQNLPYHGMINHHNLVVHNHDLEMEMMPHNFGGINMHANYSSSEEEEESEVASQPSSNHEPEGEYPQPEEEEEQEEDNGHDQGVENQWEAEEAEEDENVPLSGEEDFDNFGQNPYPDYEEEWDEAQDEPDINDWD